MRSAPAGHGARYLNTPRSVVSSSAANVRFGGAWPGDTPVFKWPGPWLPEGPAWSCAMDVPMATRTSRGSLRSPPGAAEAAGGTTHQMNFMDILPCCVHGAAPAHTRSSSHGGAHAVLPKPKPLTISTSPPAGSKSSARGSSSSSSSSRAFVGGDGGDVTIGLSAEHGTFHIASTPWRTLSSLTTHIAVRRCTSITSAGNC